MDDGIERRIGALEDREAVRELTATYCFLVDDGAYDTLADTCFAEDAVCDFHSTKPEDGMGPFLSTGREEVRAFMKTVVDALLSGMRHTVHNHRITLDGDLASGACYFELTATDAIGGGAVMGAGRYLDQYRRVGGAWQFTKRVAEIDFIAPLEKGWVQQPFPDSVSQAQAEEG